MLFTSDIPSISNSVIDIYNMTKLVKLNEVTINLSTPSLFILNIIGIYPSIEKTDDKNDKIKGFTITSYLIICKLNIYSIIW